MGMVMVSVGMKVTKIGEMKVAMRIGVYVRGKGKEVNQK